MLGLDPRAGETLRRLNATLFATEKPSKEEYPEEPPKIEDPEEPPEEYPEEPPEGVDPKEPPKEEEEEEKRETCASLGRALKNISENIDLVVKQIETANREFVKKSKELTALRKRQSDAIDILIGSGVVGGLTGGPAGAARGVVGSGLDVVRLEFEIRKKTKEVEEALRLLRINQEDLEELQSKSRELVKKYNDAGCGRN